MSNNVNYIQQKIVDLESLQKKVNDWKAEGNNVVFTNGCFDILHRGHIEYLAKAADCGSRFIVGVNSDSSVKSLEKGSVRPIQDEYSRALIIAAMEFVDAVIIFEEHTPYELINATKPDVLVKGGDYDPSITDSSNKKYIVGSDIVSENGGKVEVIQFVEGFSTSKIEEKIKKG